MLWCFKKGINFVISLLIILDDGKVYFNRNFVYVLGIVFYDFEILDLLVVCINSVFGVLFKKFIEDVNIFIWLFEGEFVFNLSFLFFFV